MAVSHRNRRHGLQARAIGVAPSHRLGVWYARVTAALKLARVGIIIFITFLFTACSENKIAPANSFKTSCDNLNCSYINYNSDSIYYKLSIDVGKNSKYEIDNHGNITVQVTKKIISCDKEFTGNDKVKCALIYYHEMAGKTNKNQRIYEVQTVAVKVVNNKGYVPVWVWENEIKIEDYGFGIFDLHFYLDATYSVFNEQLESRLNLNFKTTDYDDGYILYTLSYIIENDKWRLVSRERINTTIKDNCEEVYYRDTALKGEEYLINDKFVLTEEAILREFFK